MGSGFKDFAAGDILTAADVDGYLMRQTAMTFADASARDTALSGVLDEGMVAYLEDVNRYTFYDGSAWLDIVAGSTAGIWTAYTPTFTNLTVGNGTLSADYCRVNDFVAVRLKFVLGSTSSVSSPVSFSLPVTADSTMEGHDVGTLRMLNAGIANFAGLILFTAGGEASFQMYATVSTYLQRFAINANEPFVWGTSDTLNAFFSYKAA